MECLDQGVILFVAAVDAPQHGIFPVREKDIVGMTGIWINRFLFKFALKYIFWFSQKNRENTKMIGKNHDT